MKKTSKRLTALVLAGCMACGMAAGASAASTVASIGTKNYASLNAALRAVKNGQTVVLKSNINNANETYTNAQGKGASYFASGNTATSFTIDLNGHTIKAGEESDAGMIVYADETAKNLSITLKNGTISTSGSDVSGVLIIDDDAGTATTVTLANMTVKAAQGAGVDCFDSSLVVQSANIEGMDDAIYAENAAVQLTAGKFVSTGTDEYKDGAIAAYRVYSEDAADWAVDEVRTPGEPAIIRPADWKTNPASTVTITNFADVKSGKWYYDSVYEMARQGIVSGSNAWTFSPEGNVTREAFAQMLASASGADLNEYKGKSSFSDVAATKWSAPAIEWAKQAGVISGTGKGKFAPTASITRQEVCVMLYQYQKNVMNMPVQDVVSVGTYSDSNRVASWAKEAVDVMLREGVMSGVSNKGTTTISPNSTASRAQACTLIASLLRIAST